MQKRILFLGGSYFQIPPLKYAKEQGYYVITCDYLPDNPGHQFADEYHNVSTTDMDAVLELAKELRIDGIVAYASDPSAPTAAYVAEKMGLSGNPFEAVLTLARKDLFRNFLTENGYNVPESEAFSNSVAARSFADSLLEKGSIIVKPSDSCGSKGVLKVSSKEQFDEAFKYSLSFCRNNIVVVEEYIEKAIYEMDGDGFVYDGDLIFTCFGNQHNDIACNPHVPSGISFPYIQDEKIQADVRKTLQSILRQLGMRFGALNIEYLTDSTGKVYILEVGPRNGGNLIPEVTKYITGVDMVKYTVDAAMGVDCSDLKMKPPIGYYASFIMHAHDDGVVDRFEYSDEIKPCIVEEVRWFKEGDFVKKFNGSNCTIGTQILKFESKEQMLRIMDNMSDYQRVVVR